MDADTLSGLEIVGLEMPSGPIRHASVRLVEHLAAEGRLEVAHESLVQLLLRAADAMDHAGHRAVYAMPALSKEYREIRAELLDLTSTAADDVLEFDVVLVGAVPDPAALAARAS